jgi:hypothetical protein
MGTPASGGYSGEAMDFWDLTKVIFRRWYVGLPLLALTATVCLLTWNRSAPDYTATSYVQLMPPTVSAQSAASSNEIINPWLTGGLGLESLNSAATLVTLDATFLKSLKDRGYSENVSITEGYPNPVATIVVVSSSKEETQATTQLVVDRYVAAVDKLQTDRGVQDKNTVKTLRLDNGSNIEATTGKIKRAVIAEAAVGLMSMIGVAMAVDTAIRRRQRRREGDPETITGIHERPTPESAPRSPVDPPLMGSRPDGYSGPAPRTSPPVIITENVGATLPVENDSTVVLPLSFGRVRPDGDRRQR